MHPFSVCMCVFISFISCIPVHVCVFILCIPVHVCVFISCIPVHVCVFISCIPVHVCVHIMHPVIVCAEEEQEKEQQEQGERGPGPTRTSARTIPVASWQPTLVPFSSLHATGPCQTSGCSTQAYGGYTRCHGGCSTQASKSHTNDSFHRRFQL